MKKNIAILAGGDSGEYEISIKSAHVVKRHLDSEMFNVYLIVLHDGQLYYQDDTGMKHAVSRADFSLSFYSDKVKFDAVFMAIHGTPGEDGKLQGYLDMLDIPYTSCNQATSALTFNKFFCNNFVRSFGVKVAHSLILRRHEQFDVDEILGKLALPVFVKPNKGGSSVGTSKVKEKHSLKPAIEMALREDDEVLVEEFMPGREISCGIVKLKGSLVTLPLTEIIPRNEFFDYEAKYAGKSDEITPAPVEEVIAQRITKTSLELYRVLNCSGIVRFDYILNGTEINFLEVNTVPGFSEASIIPQQALKAGISLKELFTEAVWNAINDR